MNKRSFFHHFVLVTLLIISCNQNQAIAQRISKEDSLSAMNAFEQLKTNSKFLKDLGLTKDKHYRFNEFLQRPFFGDLNNDGSRDVMIGFVIEGRGGGNKFDVHYAVFFKLKNHVFNKNSHPFLNHFLNICRIDIQKQEFCKVC